MIFPAKRTFVPAVQERSDVAPLDLTPAPDHERCTYQPGTARCILRAGHEPVHGHVRVVGSGDAEEPQP